VDGPRPSPYIPAPGSATVSDPTGAFCPLDFRYGRPEVRALFSREARLGRALRVESALAEAEAAVGMIPPAAAAAITAAVETGQVRLERVEALEASLRHDVMAITRALAEVAGAGGAFVHLGATSADITDTALALELAESVAILDDDLRELLRTLLDLAERERATPAVGRTHGQHAVPISFGYKIAVAAAEVGRHRHRLRELSPRLLVGKMAGAVGTGAGFGAHGVEIERRVMDRLGLAADEAPTQIVGRDRIAEFTNLLALIASTAERLSTEVRNLQRTEIGEVAETFDEATQVGSSTMAQKRNPILSENISSLARLVRAFALPPMENMVQWHERDLANSANERIVLPHAIVLADDLLVKLTDVFGHLEVHRDRLAANLAGAGGLAMTEPLMLALVERGVTRSDAHEMLRRLTRGAVADRPLAALARSDPAITAHLSGDEIDRLLDPARYVEYAAEKTERIITRWRAETAA